MRIFTALAVALGVLTLAAGMVIGALIANASSLDRPQWEDPDLGPSIAEGVATEQYIWLLGWNGGLVRFNRHNGDRLILGTRVQDILVDGPHLWAVSILPDGSTFEVRDLRDSTQQTFVDEISEETPVGQLRLVRASEGFGFAVFFLDQHGLLAAASRSGSTFVGANWGEFGGRLTRYDFDDPDPTQITGLTAQEARGGCEGDFNPDCDPIVGVLPDPQLPDCVIAASGQTHMGMTHGKVYRVCGDDLTLIYETPNRTPLLARLFAPTDYWRDLSAPIESLIESRDGWIAVSTDRYFRMRNGAVSERRMPDFRHWHGLYISEEQDGVLFVVAACCNGLPFDRQAWTIAVPVLP